MIEWNEYIEWNNQGKFQGKIYCNDGSAVEFSNGDKYWLLNKLHREDGPSVEYDDGSKQWYFNGVRHREDGPAVEDTDGYKAWYLHDKRHRDDGPAVEYANGHVVWYIDGYIINYIKLDLNKDYLRYIGQFLHKSKKKYLILCFERENYYFYTVLWKHVTIEGKRYDCKLEELKRLL